MHGLDNIWRSEGAKKSKYWENQIKFLAMHITNQ